MNIEEQFNIFKDNRAFYKRLSLTRWTRTGNTKATYYFNDELLAEVFLEDECLKEPITCVVHIPHQFRAMDMNPLTFKVTTVQSAAYSVETFLLYSGAHDFLYKDYERKESERRRKLALERINALKEKNRIALEKLEENAIKQIPVIFDNIDVFLSPVPTFTQDKQKRQRIKLYNKLLEKSKKKSDKQVFKELKYIEQDSLGRQNNIYFGITNRTLSDSDVIRFINKTGMYIYDDEDKYRDAGWLREPEVHPL